MLEPYQECCVKGIMQRVRVFYKSVAPRASFQEDPKSAFRELLTSYKSVHPTVVSDCKQECVSCLEHGSEKSHTRI